MGDNIDGRKTNKKKRYLETGKKKQRSKGEREEMIKRSVEVKLRAKEVKIKGIKR